MDIACVGPGEKITVKNSDENAAFEKFSEENRKLRVALESFKNKNLKETFSQIQPLLKDYYNQTEAIRTAHPNTYTASVLCAAEQLLPGSLDSPEKLQENFFQREALANPVFYNSFLSSRIFTNYLDCIVNREKISFDWAERALNIAAKNPEASKRFQQVLHDLLYFRHEEDLLNSFIKWAQANPAKMHNPSVKMRLQGMSRIMSGNPMIDVQLPGPDGQQKKLSDLPKASKVTLLIFYSPTCSHCQEELPQLVPIWQQYKSKGLKIFAVAFDATNDEWKWFINNKATPEWTHVFEPSTGNPPSAQYVVNYTPTYVFIDPSGKIISRFATFEEVKKKIPQLLGG